MDEEQSSPQGWARARWARRPYEVRDGWIAPAPGGSVEFYDPFAASGSAGPQGPLYRALWDVDLEQSESIEFFASRWGLLGLFQHRLIQARHAAPGMAEVLEGLDFLAVARTDAQLTVSAALVERPEGGYSERPLAEYYRRYFPGLRTDVQFLANEIPPLTHSPALFDRLAEPVEEFREEVARLKSTVAVAQRAAEGQLPLGEFASPGIYTPTVGENLLHAAIDPYIRRVHQGLKRREDGSGWELGWYFPSLISVIYYTLAMHLAGGQLRRCANDRCGAPFAPTHRKHQQYCSDRCQNFAKQRRRVARTREESTP